VGITQAIIHTFISLIDLNTAIKTTPSGSTSDRTTMNHSKDASIVTTKSSGNTNLSSTTSSTPKDSTISKSRKCMICFHILNLLYIIIFFFYLKCFKLMLKK
jgi:hypothetical protein